MDIKSIGRSIGQFNYENYVKNLATKVTTYTVGGVPLMTYGCFGMTAALIGTMIFYEGGTTPKDDTPKQEEEKKPEPTEEEEEVKSGGGNKKKRKTRRKNKRKPKH